MISVEGVSKRFGELLAVDRLTFEVRHGEVVGFLGPNGAGKSTTMRMLTGALQPDEGRVLFDGVSIGDDLTGAKRRVGYLPENNALYPDLLVSEYLEYVCRLRELPSGGRAGALARAVDETGIGSVFHRPIGELSKGFRQRVGLAAAIVHEPEILVLDEPTEGLDPNQRVGIRALISELGRSRTVVLSTHVLGEVEATCTRLLILSRGQLAADGTVSELLDAARTGVRYVVEAEGAEVPERLRTLPGVTWVGVEHADGRVRARLLAVGEEDLRPQVFRLASDSGWTLWELYRERQSLEHLFRTLTESAGEPNQPPMRAQTRTGSAAGAIPGTSRTGGDGTVALVEGGGR